jgi:hypothetical protein
VWRKCPSIACQELLELVPAGGESYGQPDRRPHRVAAADPVPEAEDAILIDAELRRFLKVGGEGGEMVMHRLLAQGRRQPVARGMAVGHGLQRREGLAGHQHQGPRRIQFAGELREGVAVDVREEVRFDLRAMDPGQRRRDHARPEVGAADADVEHIREGLAVGGHDGAVMHPADEGLHPLPLMGRDLGGILEAAFGQHGAVAGIGQAPQRHVHRRAMLGHVHRLAGEEALDEVLHLRGAGEFQQPRQRFRADRGLGEVEEHILEARREFRRPLGVGFEERRDQPAAGGSGECRQLVPGWLGRRGGERGVRHCGSSLR